MSFLGRIVDRVLGPLSDPLPVPSLDDAAPLPPPPDHRTCRVCLEARPLTAFRPHDRGGRRHVCAACEVRARREREKRQAAPEFVDEPTCPGEPVPPAVEPEPVPSPNRFAALLDATRKTRSLSDLCDALDLAPGKLRALIEEARAAGYVLHVENDHVGRRERDPDERIQAVGIAPAIGERQRVAVISDTHLGSKYCLRDQLRDFVEYAYAQGCREVLHPGDVIDGCYRHSEFEVSHVGLDDQAQDLFEVLPALPGLTYHAITGNHDHTFTERGGMDVGRFLSRYFEERGRGDLIFHGNRSAFLRLRGATIHLWHPGGGGAYAKSYKLQKKIEAYSPGEKPDILLVGHYHQSCYLDERGVHGLLCPTFQGPGSQFGNSLVGAPAVGGLILEWETTAHGTIRHFSVERTNYFKREAPREIAT